MLNSYDFSVWGTLNKGTQVNSNQGNANVVVSGGGTVTAHSAWGETGQLSNLYIQNGTNLVLNHSVSAENIFIGNNTNNAVTTTFKGNVTANIINIGGTGNADTYTALFDASNQAITVAGALNKVHTGTATAVIQGGQVTTTSAWGATTALNTVTLQNGGYLILGNNLDADNVIIDAESKLITSNNTVNAPVQLNDGGALSLSNGGTINDAVTAGGANQGTLVFTGASTVIGNVGAGAQPLAAISLQGSDQNIDLQGDLHSAQTTNINDNELRVAGTFDSYAGQKLRFTVSGEAGTSGQIITTGNATVNAGTQVYIDAIIGDNIQFDDNGNIEPITLIDGTNAAAGAIAPLNSLIGDSSLRLEFVQTADVNSLVVNVNEVATNASLLSGNYKHIGTIIDQLQASPNLNEDLDRIVGSALTVSTVDQLKTLMESLQPASSAAPVVADVSRKVQGQAARRVALLRNGNSNQGINAGDPLAGTHIWGQFFGNKIDQDTRDGVAGYDSDTTGIMLGIDTGDYWDDRTVGLALSNANTNIDYETRNTSKSEINSVQLTAYGDYNLSSTAFLTAMMGYAHNSIETTRRNVGSVAGRTAVGTTDGHQYSASLELGNDFHLNAAGGVMVTPSILASYSHISQDKYTETGAGGVSLIVDVDNSEIFDLGMNVEMAWQHEMSDGSTLEPTIHFGYSYDLIADEVESTSRFTGGGASFKTEGLKPERSIYNAGVGLALFSGDHWELSGGYDFEYKDGYKAHSGSIKATYKF